MKDELSTSNEQLLTIDAVVLANGEYPASPLPLKILAEAPYVVCCDGGADEYIRRGHTPDVIIGDGDSLSDENRRKFGHILHRISDQETNDQTKAVNFLLAKGKRRIAIIGATGKREDHTLGNISLLIDYLRAGARCTYLYRLRHLHPQPEYPHLPKPSRTASIHHQLHCTRSAWQRTGLSPQRFHQLVARHTQRMHQYGIHHRGGRGIPGIRHYFFASATSTKYTLIQIMAMAAACVQLKRSCPKVRETTVVTTSIR